MTSLTEIALFTDDVAKVSAFYRGLVSTDPVAEWPGGVLFAVGAGKVLVHERAAEMAEGPPNEDHFALAVEDLDGACRRSSRTGSPSSSSHVNTRGVALPTSAIRTAGWSSSRRRDSDDPLGGAVEQRPAAIEPHA
jgi:hypothetical protein